MTDFEYDPELPLLLREGLFLFKTIASVCSPTDFPGCVNIYHLIEALTIAKVNKEIQLSQLLRPLLTSETSNADPNLHIILNWFASTDSDFSITSTNFTAFLSFIQSKTSLIHVLAEFQADKDFNTNELEVAAKNAMQRLSLESHAVAQDFEQRKEQRRIFCNTFMRTHDKTPCSAHTITLEH